MAVVGILPPPKQTKESARRDDHMFLLSGALLLWTICFYCVALGHMFLLYGCGPYVSIVWRSAICFYCVALGHMFLLCGARPYVSIVCVTICFHRRLLLVIPYFFIIFPHPSPPHI